MNILEKIKKFFTKIFSNRNVKKIEEAKESVEQINASKQQEKLDQGITELNILKNKNKNYEKNRIIYLYKEVKAGNVDLMQLGIEDLKKIRALFYEEAKIRDTKLGEDIDELEKALIAATTNN